MAQPTEQTIIAALDIGSSKVSAMIARQDEDGRVTVLGTGQRESRGVKRGFITDMAASEFAVREAVELAERMSGLTVEDVWASYGAGGLVSDVANVEVELGGHPVEQADIDQLMTAGKEAIDRNGQVVLHAHPALYTIDRAQGVEPGRAPVDEQGVTRQQAGVVLIEPVQLVFDAARTVRDQERVSPIRES